MTPACYVGDHTVLLRTQRGTKMFVDSTDTVVSPHLILDGEWESWVTSYIERRLLPGQFFIDVGAHCGWYTLLGCQLVGPHGSVVGVEPNPKLARLIRRSLSINGFGHGSVLEGAAVEPEKHGEKMTLHVPEGFSGNASVAEDAHGVEVPTVGVCLDDFVQMLENVRTPDLIKIDAERYEARVVQGCRRMLECIHAPELIIEHHDGDADLFSELWSLGFESKVIAHDGSLIAVANADALAMLPDSEMVSCRK